jgi:ATP-dependent DNA helicase RecQ
MGLIEDYKVENNDKMYSLTVVKRNTKEYVDRLFEFIKRYCSEVKTRREIEKIDQSDGKFIIRNCINFLTDFIYDELEKKRRVAADDINAA